MYEANNENNDSIETALPTVSELQSKVAELEKKLSWAQEARDYNSKKLDEVRSYIQASIDNEDWTDEELDEIFWTELADKLDLEIKKTVEIVIKATWTATVRMKRSQDLYDLDISVSEPEASYGVELDNVYERDFDITEA